MVKLGIIGAGNIAAAHVRNILEGRVPGVTIAALADRKESRRQWAQETVPDAQIFCEGSVTFCFCDKSKFTHIVEGKFTSCC